ncbi:MAG TPA: NADH-quinone oxidoreductase subunit NuoG [Pseudomonadales bacterium]|nr:NADH-quinone oxidoreductase subunit NuoG [Pseudomonadales bacterium]
MAIIHVDGKQYEVDPTDNLLQACLSRGLDLPYFCWHPALGSVGSCRQCAVKVYRDENDKVGRLVMACMTPATDNTRMTIGDAESKEFREGIIALMMTNHPHDCPVCEEGGHCHLQDMTVMTGHYRRQYHFTKRTHLNQELGPFVAHEMNRCIACYRCVRFYNDYAGGTDFGAFGSAANVYFGRVQSGTLENYFSGNLTEVCPTGVFTDKTHSERYARKWDMQFAPSICSGCAVGCNISPGERYGEVRRIENRYHGELNGYFLCDRGRFGYGYVNRKDRPRKPLAKHGEGFANVDNASAITRIRQLLTSGKPVIGIGSARASVEANFELRTLVGAAAFSNGMTRHESELCSTVLGVLRDGPVPAATIRAIDEADAVLVLGEDVLATAPRVALALRQAARGKSFDMTRDKKVPDWQAESAADIGQHEMNPIFVATPAATGFDDIATATFRLAPDAIAQLGFAVAHALDASAPAAAADGAAASAIAAALRSAKRPLVVSGTGAGSADVIRAAANVAYALAKSNPATRISLAVPEANSLAMALFDARPLEDALASIEHADSIVVVLENDLDRRLQTADVDRLVERAKLVVLDHQMTATARRADVVLPAASFAEATGTLVNMEGRAQRYFQNFDPAYYDRSIATLESWRWLGRIRGGDAEHENLDDVLADIEAALPQFKGIVDAAPGAKFRMHGMGLARAPHRQSGRTAARAIVFVHEPKATVDDDTALNFSMEGYNGAGREDRPPELLPFAWAPGWNSPQAWTKFQTEVGGALRGGDPGVHLLKPSGRAGGYFSPTAARRGDDLQAIPLHEHFGSEELSNLAAPIQTRIPAAYVVLNSDEVRRLGIGDAARVSIDGVGMHLAVRARDDFPRNGVGLPVGLPGIVPFAPTSLCTVARTQKGG